MDDEVVMAVSWFEHIKVTTFDINDKHFFFLESMKDGAICQLIL